MKVSTQTLALKKAHRIGYNVTKSGIVLNKKGEEVKTNTSPSGYKYFNLKFRRNGNSCYGQVYIHRLQALQKYGDSISKKGVHCRHINGDKLDNSYNNIFIGDAADNRADFLKLSKGRRSKTVTFFKKRFGRYELVLNKKIVD